jgi:hypothetical protein
MRILETKAVTSKAEVSFLPESSLSATLSMMFMP